jgi:hypothetical protein
MLPKYDQEFLENWMFHLKEDIAAVPLRHLKIPGTHDSNTFAFSYLIPGTSFARCQGINIEAQMKLGVRMLDLRYGPNPQASNVPKAVATKVPVVLDQHGPFAGYDFLIHLRTIRHFVETHPDEFFIVNVQWEKQMSHSQNEYLIHQIQQIFAPFLVTHVDLEGWFDLRTVTHRDVLAHKQRILCVVRSSLWEGTSISAENCASIGIHDQDKLVSSTWHNCGSTEKLFAANSKDIEERDQTRFLVSQMIITLRGEFNFIAGNLLRGTYPSIYNVNKALHKKRDIHKFVFWNLKNQKGNIFMFDYIEYDPILPLMIVASNCRAKMDVRKFVVEERPLDSRMDECLAGDSIFFVPKVKYLTTKVGIPRSDLLLAYAFHQQPVHVGLWGPEQTVLAFRNPLREAHQHQVHSYLVFLRSGKFVVKMARDKTEFNKMNQFLSRVKHPVKGFWIPQEIEAIPHSGSPTPQSPPTPPVPLTPPTVSVTDLQPTSLLRDESIDAHFVLTDPSGEKWKQDSEKSPGLRMTDSLFRKDTGQGIDELKEIHLRLKSLKGGSEVSIKSPGTPTTNF